MKRAVISVWDKTGIVELADELHRAGYEILSTAKTAQMIRDSGIPVCEISEYTGSPEILGGRVKTLHPKIAGGILSTRQDLTVEPIDVVVCNLYPFQEGLARNATDEELTELIDIGGVTLLRAAAKNWRFVTVVPHPNCYALVAETLKADVQPDTQLRRKLAAAAFRIVADYDQAIAAYFARTTAGGAQC